MKHFYMHVPGMGNVAFSRHAQRQAKGMKIPESIIKDVLFNGEDTPDGMDMVWREKKGIRLVIILFPTPNIGAKLVKAIYKVKQQERVR